MDGRTEKAVRTTSDDVRSACHRRRGLHRLVLLRSTPRVRSMGTISPNQSFIFLSMGNVYNDIMKHLYK